MKRRSWVLVLTLLVVWLACSRDKSSPTPIFPRVPRENFAATWSDRPVVLLGIGDSVTAGFGASKGRSYFELLTANAPDDPPDISGVNLALVLPGLKAHNVSMSYSTSAEHLQHQIDKLPAFPEDTLGIVVITSGGNDIIHDYGQSPPRDGAMYGATYDEARPWIAALRERLLAIVSGLKKRFPGGCHIFLANVYDPTDGVGDIHNAPLPLPRWPEGLAVLWAVNDVVSEIARADPDVHLVDIHSAFLGHGIHHDDPGSPHYRPEDTSYWYYENLEDPNDVGYDCIRRLFLTEISDVLSPDPPSPSTSKAAPCPTVSALRPASAPAS